MKATKLHCIHVLTKKNIVVKSKIDLEFFVSTKNNVIKMNIIRVRDKDCLRNEFNSFYVYWICSPVRDEWNSHTRIHAYTLTSGNNDNDTMLQRHISFSLFRVQYIWTN